MKVPSLYNYFKVDFMINVLIILELDAISGTIKFIKLHSVIGDKEICTLRFVTQSPDLTTIIEECPIPFSDSVSSSG